MSETTNLYKENKVQFEKQQQEMKAWNNELADQPAFKGLLMAKKSHEQKVKAYNEQKKKQNKKNKK